MAISGGAASHLQPAEHRDRQAIGRRQDMQGSATTLDLRTNHWLAQQLPQAGQGWGTLSWGLCCTPIRGQVCGPIDSVRLTAPISDSSAIGANVKPSLVLRSRNLVGE